MQFTDKEIEQAASRMAHCVGIEWDKLSLAVKNAIFAIAAEALEAAVHDRPAADLPVASYTPEVKEARVQAIVDTFDRSDLSDRTAVSQKSSPLNPKGAN